MKKIFTLIFLMLGCFTFKAFAYDVIVAKDGSGNFLTIQAAINAAPTGLTTAYTIFIRNGKYKEVVTIPTNKPFLQLIGESVSGTIITYDNYSGKLIPGGGGAMYGTNNSATVFINANDCAAFNLTMENSTGQTGDGPQAVALYVTGDRCVFKTCRFISGQDTIWTNGNGRRNYFRNCYIDGNTDFIFGSMIAVFDSCVIFPRDRVDAGSGGFITAANTPQGQAYGYVFRDCQIPANRGVTNYTMGRPWQNDAGTAPAARSHSKTVWLNTRMSKSITAPGWSIWDAGTDVSVITYAEYKSRKFDGTLTDVSGRVPWSQQLTDAQAAPYYVNSNLFGTWDPCSVTADMCSPTPTPLAISNFRGRKGTSTTVFTWNIAWPVAQVTMDLQRSSDNITFTSVNQQITPNDTAVNYTYTESVPPPGQTFYYIIKASKAGYDVATSDTITISSTPTINVSGAFGSFIQGLGQPSTQQSYVVSGVSLTNNIVITAPAGYEISSNGGTTWNTSANPITLTPVNGVVANTTIAVRLNATAAGTYTDSIVHTSTGAATAKLAVNGTVQTAPLTQLKTLLWWPFTTNNTDSTAVRSVGVNASTTRLNNLYVSQGFNTSNVPAYSVTYGQALSAVLGTSSANDGSWGTPGGPGGNVNRNFYEEFVIKANSAYAVRVDSFLLKGSFFLSANGRLAAVYSRTGFTTNDSTNVPGAAFNSPLALAQNNVSITDIRLALNGGTGITLASGDSLTIRVYLAVGSANVPRFALLKDVMFKGLETPNPVAGDYQTHQSGDWTDLATWERWDGTNWVTPAPAYPVYTNANTTKIRSGHTATISATLPTGSGYIDRTTIAQGGQLIVNAGASLNIANDGAPSTATTDLQVDGAMSLFGGLFTNGNVSVVVNGSFIHSGTNINLSNGGDTVKVNSNATWQHNVNSGTTPNNMIWGPTATFLITGITTNQTGIFKSNINYGNIIWNNTGEANYYAFRNTLHTNVQGSFTVASTGSTNITFANASGTIAFPGGFIQTGGTVNFKESGNVMDTLVIGGDFAVTGGSFTSGMGTGSSLLVNLNGTNRMLTYNQSGATNTNWNVNGVYSLGANLALISSAYKMSVAGTLNTGTYSISGPGDFTVLPGGIISSGAASGLNGNIAVTGAKTMSTTANYIFNGTMAQVTGVLLPAIVNSLTINNASGVSVSSATNISGGALALLSGKLSLGNNNLTTNSITGASSANYIITDGTGALKINNIGAGINRFPVGASAASYNPVTLNNAGTVDNFSVNVKSTFSNPVPDANRVVTKEWNITPDNLSGTPNVTIGLGWQTANQAPGFNPAAATAVMHFLNSTWTNTDATITGTGTLADPYIATASGITAFSPFGIINTGALPLKLISFKADYSNNQVHTLWTTANEIGTKLFQVERSTDAQLFTSLAMINAMNAAGTHNYQYSDASPFKGISYYRLKMIDIDGTITYSKVVAVNSGVKGTMLLYPNPVKDQLQVMHSPAGTKATVQILTAEGKMILVKNISANTQQTGINVAALPAGNYTLRFLNNTEQNITRFTKL